MKTPSYLCFVLVAALAACHAEPVTTAPTPERDVSAWPLYGAELGSAQPMELAALFDGAQVNDGRAFVVEGEVASVCQTKGCWMVLAEGERSMRVKFKDYAFFVPTDIEGRTVRFDGVFAVEETPVEEVRHYLEDAGKHAEAALVTEPKREFVFLASGVRVGPK